MSNLDIATLILLVMVYPFPRFINKNMQDDLFKFDPPLWFRRILFIKDIDDWEIPLSTIVFQAVTNLTVILFVLSLFGLDIVSIVFGVFGFEVVGEVPPMVFWFITLVLVGIYICFCGIVTHIRRKRGDYIVQPSYKIRRPKDGLYKTKPKRGKRNK